LKGCAVNVTDVPAQIVGAVDVILTESVTGAELTVMMITFELDVAGVAHPPDGVMIQETALPLAKVVDV
jgi:hypothetical protein